MKNADDNLINFRRDDKGNFILSHGSPQLAASYFNFSSAAGINYIVDVSKPAGERITISALTDGKPFDLKKSYTVAINSYQANGGGGLLTLGAKIPKDEITGRIVTTTPKDLRYYLMKWIEDKKIVNPEALNNWSVIPKDWWEKGKEKDAKLLFKENIIH
jgi:2',3'-cyclic-nucleotide 2'-phosphodiesterase/3'-nucleotidase